jgi:hypothetical protein
MTPFVLYVQEDYLLEADVNDDKLTELMRDIEDCNIGHLRLYEVWEEDESVYGNISGFPELLELQGHAIYRTSLQAAVWKTSLLKSLVREKDSGWRFERLGWCRTPAGQERFACLNRHLNNTIFPYTPTGIIRGKWNSRVIETMYRNYGIHIDTTVRGTIAPVKVAYSNTHVRRLIAKAKKLTVRCARANSTIMGAVRILDDLNI